MSSKKRLSTNRSRTSGDNLAIVPDNVVKAAGAVIQQQHPLEIKNDGQVRIRISDAMSSDIPEIFGTFSMHDVDSTTNLLGLESNSVSTVDLALYGRDATNQRHTANIVINATTAEAHLLRPSDKNNLNNSSQSSIDTRIKFTADDLDVDMIPLMPISTSASLVNEKAASATSKAKPDESSDLSVARANQQNERQNDHHEKWYVITLQILLPFFIAGFGMVGAGVVLDIVQHWSLFIDIKAIFTLIPALLGLKGNLEMTLASRFSTQVNLGLISDRSSTLSAVLGNFALTQAQAIIVGFLASVGAIALRLFTEREFDLENSLVLIAGSVSTASFASLILAGLMMFVIILSKRVRINPDNVATPIAASLGDLVTLSILSLLCTFLYQIRVYTLFQVLLVGLYLLLVPVFIYYSYRNSFVQEALYHGWVPIILAMVISSSGGAVMGFAVSAYQDIAVFQPVVNGVGGNLVAIFASRLSTALHRSGVQGSRVAWTPARWYLYPVHTFFGKTNPEAKTALILAILAVPGHLIFFFAITKIKALSDDPVNPATLTASFITFYLSISTLQILILLLICYWLVHLAWRKNKNPDNVCIPYLTAIGDMLGMVFLAICFHGLYLAGATGLRRVAISKKNP